MFVRLFRDLRDDGLNEVGNRFVDGGEPRGELQVVHCLFRLLHAVGDQVDLAGDVVRLLSIHGHFRQRLDLVFKAVEFEADPEGIGLRPFVVGLTFLAGLQIVLEGAAELCLLYTSDAADE